MPEARLTNARKTLPEGYQFGDAAKRPYCFHCGHLGHGWMRCQKLMKEADEAMSRVYVESTDGNIIEGDHA